jgi:hypothetical protein
MITAPTTNVYSGPAYWSGYTGVLDMQLIALPGAFSNQTLTSVELIDNGSAGVQRTAIDGLTVVSPMPSASSFTEQPVSQVVSPGQSVTFTAAATGFPPPTYQWQFKGSNISGATNASYTLSSTTITNIGSYDVVISNAVNTNISSVATLAFINLNMLAAVYVTGPLGAQYLIESTPALGPTNWITLTNVTITSQPYIYVDYSTPTNKYQFYRAVPQ